MSYAFQTNTGKQRYTFLKTIIIIIDVMDHILFVDFITQVMRKYFQNSKLNLLRKNLTKVNFPKNHIIIIDVMVHILLLDFIF